MRHLRSKLAALPLVVALAIALVGAAGVSPAAAEETDRQDSTGQEVVEMRVNKPSPTLVMAGS